MGLLLGLLLFCHQYFDPGSPGLDANYVVLVTLFICLGFDGYPFFQGEKQRQKRWLSFFVIFGVLFFDELGEPFLFFDEFGEAFLILCFLIGGVS